MRYKIKGKGFIPLQVLSLIFTDYLFIFIYLFNFTDYLYFNYIRLSNISLPPYCLLYFASTYKALQSIGQS